MEDFLTAEEQAWQDYLDLMKDLESDEDLYLGYADDLPF